MPTSQEVGPVPLSVVRTPGSATTQRAPGSRLSDEPDIDDPSQNSWNWRTLIKPFKPVHAGTMPVGLVLIIMVVALVLATLLNADSTLRKSRANGDGYRQNVAKVIASVSNATGFNIPRERLDAALGRQGSNTKDLDELLAEKQSTTPTSETTEPTTDNSQPAPAADGTPTLRTPTADNPLTIWMGGDSVAEAFTVGLEPISAATGLFKPVADYRVSTGLVRPEYFNWPNHFATEVLPKTDPDVMVVMFGANDGQNLEVDGKVIDRYTPEWYVAYGDRVGKVMDLLRSPDDDRLIIWVGLPPPGPGSRIGHIDAINYVYWREASKRPWMSYLDTWAYMGGSGPNFGFVGTMPTADGRSKNMYQSDNLHLNVQGAHFLSWAVMNHLGALIDMSGSKTPTPPAADAPPAGITERKELPKPAEVP